MLEIDLQSGANFASRLTAYYAKREAHCRKLADAAYCEWQEHFGLAERYRLLVEEVETVEKLFAWLADAPAVAVVGVSRATAVPARLIRTIADQSGNIGGISRTSFSTSLVASSSPTTSPKKARARPKSLTATVR